MVTKPSGRKASGLPFYTATVDVPKLSENQKLSEETIGHKFDING